MSQCPRCRLDLSLYPPGASGTCPNCGAEIKTPETGVTPPERGGQDHFGPGATMFLLRRFWTTLSGVILSPSRFYRDMAPAVVGQGGVSSALAFAIIVQWLAAFFNFVWKSVLGAALGSRAEDFGRIVSDVFMNNAGQGAIDSLDRVRQQLLDFLFGAGAIILTPFTALFKLVVFAALIHVAVRFFMRDAQGRPQSYSATLKILAYSSAPWILCIIPGLGVLLAWILVFFAAVIGLREVYQTTTTRAVFAVIFPELLFAALFFGMIFMFLFLAFNVLRLVF